MVPLTVLPLDGAVRVTAGGDVSPEAAPAAWLTVKELPAMVKIPERELVLVFAPTE